MGSVVKGLSLNIFITSSDSCVANVMVLCSKCSINVDVLCDLCKLTPHLLRLTSVIYCCFTVRCYHLQTWRGNVFGRVCLSLCVVSVLFMLRLLKALA